MFLSLVLQCMFGWEIEGVTRAGQQTGGSGGQWCVFDLGAGISQKHAACVGDQELTFFVACVFICCVPDTLGEGSHTQSAA